MLKLGVQLHLTPALSKACHPQCIKERFRINGVLYMLFQAIEQQLIPSINSCQGKEGVPFAQFKPGSSGEFATIWYSPPFERTVRPHILS